MSHTFDDKIIIPSLQEQMGLALGGEEIITPDTGVYFSAEEIDITIYDKIIICMSGGKDSWATLLHLYDIGVDRSKIELWHHDVDGREGSTLMDWAFMADYNRKLAEHFNHPLYFSWLKGGMEREMLKENEYSQPHMIETPDGLLELPRDTKRSKPSTRLKFPQVGANLQTRWCSSALKIDVGRRQLTNQTRFDQKKVLFITGERRQESSNRAKYNQFEPHMVDCRAGKKGRHVDVWRPVLHWQEDRVWDALQRHGVLAPVPYRLGWGRSSCMTCIFNSPTIWATIREYFPEKIMPIASLEDRFGTTISRDRINVLDVLNKAKPMEISDLVALDQAMREDYILPVVANAEHKWAMPAGAFNESVCGPS